MYQISAWRVHPKWRLTSDAFNKQIYCRPYLLRNADLAL